jgi:hypothetical protein
MNFGTLHQHNIGWVVKDQRGVEHLVHPDNYTIENMRKFKIGKEVSYKQKGDFVIVEWLEN